MSKVYLMPMELANKIAAGEVVERPSSVIKELVENSIDAEATEITVSIIDGGRTMIKVIDNGCGMSKEDAVLSFSRHASSKIRNTYDLDSLKTLGFRGEAIPSIASVSNFTMETSDGVTGTKIVKTPDADLIVSNGTLRKGTTITIEKLFYNVPARLKFLKSDKFEKMKCVEVMENIALGFPNIQFIVKADEKVVFKTSGRNNLLEAIFQVRGSSIAKNLYKIHHKENGLEIDGYISKPETNFSSRFEMHTYINSRVIYNYKLNRCIEEVYKDYLAPNRYPYTCINFKIDPYLVDVNVHPSKKEVKISNEEHIISVLKNVIKEKLLSEKPTYNINFKQKDEPSQQEKLINEEELVELLNKSNFSSFSFEDKTKAETNDAFDLNDLPFDLFETKKENEDKIEHNFSSFENKHLILNDSQAKTSNSLLSLNLTPLGQISNTYIVFDSEKGLVLMDQHAAAERINFEKYNSLFKNPIYSATPLIPILIDVSPNLMLNFDDEHKNNLKNIGIICEEFGQNTIKVSEIPTFLLNKEEYISDIITLCLQDKSISYTDLIKDTIASIACKASIKANRKLTFDEIQHLVAELIKCENPANCPHGRPTVILLTLQEIEKLFKRTGGF